MKTVSKIKVPADARFVSMDIEDFSWKETARQSLQSAASSSMMATNVVFIGSLNFILKNQFASTGKAVYQVVEGSGMGLSCSGDVCDVCFFSLCEKGFATNNSWFKNCGILDYCRYKDDIMIIHSGPFAGLQRY